MNSLRDEPEVVVGLRARLTEAAERYHALTVELEHTAASVKRQRDENRALIAQIAEQRSNDPVKVMRERDRAKSAVERAIHRSKIAEDNCEALIRWIEDNVEGSQVMRTAGDRLIVVT